jgi:hypothetical protein
MWQPQQRIWTQRDHLGFAARLHQRLYALQRGLAVPMRWSQLSQECSTQLEQLLPVYIRNYHKHMQ